MKQVSDVTKTSVTRSSHNLISQLRVCSKYLSVLLLAVLAIFASSFKGEILADNAQNSLNKSISFKGKYTFSFGANGVSGTGTGSHIGRFMLLEQNNEEGFPVITGTATITAANGDQIFATHTGYIQITGNGIAHVDAEFIITGGTGDFAEATGSFISNGPANLALGTGSASFDGTIYLK